MENEVQPVEQANPSVAANEAPVETGTLPEYAKQPIPEGSILTEEMVNAYENYFKCNRDIAIGSLLAWESGKTSLESRFVDLEIAFGTGVFAPLRAAYFKAVGQVEPPLSLTPENATQEEEQKVQEAVAEAKVEAAEINEAKAEDAKECQDEDKSEAEAPVAEGEQVEGTASTSEEAAQ